MDTLSCVLESSWPKSCRGIIKCPPAAAPTTRLWLLFLHGWNSDSRKARRARKEAVYQETDCCRAAKVTSGEFSSNCCKNRKNRLLRDAVPSAADRVCLLHSARLCGRLKGTARRRIRRAVFAFYYNYRCSAVHFQSWRYWTSDWLFAGLFWFSLLIERSSKTKRAEPFQPRPSSHVVAKLLLDLRLPRPCRRAIAFTETLAASAIPPLDETRSQVVAPAIAANQLV